MIIVRPLTKKERIAIAVKSTREHRKEASLRYPESFEIIELANAGLNCQEIAREMRVSVHKVVCILNHLKRDTQFSRAIRACNFRRINRY